MAEKKYLCIDLKSFYASVECVERGLNPLTTNLVVADSSRTEKTICLAVTPSLKSFGIPGRARLFEVVQKVREVNYERRRKAPGQRFKGASYNMDALNSDPSLGLDYIVAPPQMARYMEYSTRIYEKVYLKHIAPEDIHVYSVDEVFIDLTPYLKYNHTDAHGMTVKIIKDILKETGITATAGIGTNLYLAKVAMDITAKKMPADKDGVRIAELDEMEYRKQLWNHRPLTDFWRIGKGYATKLEANGMYTMGDVALCSVGGIFEKHNEALLYKLFGKGAELLIDHAWGWEPCEISDIKSYKPSSNSLSSGQVLSTPYSFEKARLVAKEMLDMLVLDLVEKKLVAEQVTVTVGYDAENLTDPLRSVLYKGEVTYDHYGRPVPKHGHGGVTFSPPTSSTEKILKEVMQLYDRVIDRNLLVRKITVCANNVVPENIVQTAVKTTQLDLFTDPAKAEAREEREKKKRQKEKNLQKALIDIKKKYGKNGILKGMNYTEGATAKDRNNQIGGHKK